MRALSFGVRRKAAQYLRLAAAGASGVLSHCWHASGVGDKLLRNGLEAGHHYWALDSAMHQLAVETQA